MPFYTKAYVHVPKDKRKTLMKKGQGHQRAEEGRLVGYHDTWSTTYKVLLSENRIVHSRNVNFDISDFKTEATQATTPPAEELLTSKFIKGLSLPSVANKSNGSTHPGDQIDSGSIPEGDMPSPLINNDPSIVMEDCIVFIPPDGILSLIHISEPTRPY